MRVYFKLLAAFLASAIAWDVYAQDISLFNSGLPDYGLVQGPDGYYLTRQKGAWGQSAGESIFYFSEPGAPGQPVPWADTSWHEGDFYYSAARSLGCFIREKISATGQGNPQIWCVRWQGDQWGAPYELPASVNSEAAEYSPVLRPDGSLYFASARKGGAGFADIYRAWMDGDAWSVERLSDAVNSSGGEWNLEIDPDGTVMIFEASHRKTNRTISGDLYASRLVGGHWSAAVPLSRLNTDGSDLMPRFINGRLVMTTSEGKDADLRSVDLLKALPVPPLVAAVSRSAGDIVLLDPQTLETIRRIPVGAGPHDIAASEDGRTAVVPLFGIFPQPHDGPISPDQLKWQSQKSEGLAVLDLATGAARRFPMEDCRRSHGAAATAQAHIAWVTCETEGTLHEIDPATGKPIRVFELSKGVHKVMHLAGSRSLAATNPQAGALHLIDLKTGSVSTLNTGKGTEAIAATRDQKTIYVANAFDRTVCRVDVADQRLGACVPSGGKFPIAIAVDDIRGLIWVANNASSNIVALDAEGLGRVKTIDLPSRPLGLAYDPKRGRIYVGLPRRNEVLAIDAQTGNVVARTTDVMEVDDIDLIPAAHFGTAPDT